MASSKIYSPQPVMWETAAAPVLYPHAAQRMETIAAQIAAGEAPERVWLLEHPPLYTAGTSANPDDLVTPDRFDVFQTGRGGQYTYHGPGQRVAYVMLDLKQRGRDVGAFICGLEQLIIDSLAKLGVNAERRKGRVGVWIAHEDGREEKIAAIGVRLRKWVSFHGISINVDPDLTHFGGIVPCGISDHGVTSLKALGTNATMEMLDDALRESFTALFGPVERP